MAIWRRCRRLRASSRASLGRQLTGPAGPNRRVLLRIGPILRKRSSVIPSLSGRSRLAETALTDAVPFDTIPRDAEAIAAEQLVVNVGGYEGPLDLLLTMARTQKVDLAKISILKLAEQYLEFVKEAEALRIGRASCREGGEGSGRAE